MAKEIIRIGGKRKTHKKAIFTIVSGEKYEKIWQRVEKRFIAYSEKCDADLIVIQGTTQDLPSPHWIKMSIRDMLHKEFDRVAFVDADILIRDDCPSLFDIVPEDSFGIFNEGEFTPRNVCIYEVMKKYRIENFKYDGTTYYNTGVMVCSKQHRHIFKVEKQIIPLRNAFGEQTYLNMKIMLSGCKIFPLSYKFNRMSIMDRVLGMTRLDSFMIHYAGDGWGPTIEKMDYDIKRWEENPGYQYKRKIFLWALGGTGDVVSAEPVVRHIREKVHKDADIWLMSLQPEVFEHIDGITRSKDYPEGEFDAVLEINTHQLPWEKFGKYVPFQTTHCVDWVSLIALGKQLADKEKEIHLVYSQEHLNEVLAVIGGAGADFSNMVLVHPGTGWESKTFPVEYWNSIIKGLLDTGFEVGVIGKKVNEAHSVLDVDATGCIDFRDKLSLKGLFALIARAPILISNDSAPIHIAGAFDNYILMIPTCKHPDHVMPFRKGFKYYKAKALYKKLMEDDGNFRGLAGEVWIAKDIPEGHTIGEYLPDVEDVILTVMDFAEQDRQRHLFSSSKRKRGLENDISMESH